MDSLICKIIDLSRDSVVLLSYMCRSQNWVANRLPEQGTFSWNSLFVDAGGCYSQWVNFINKVLLLIKKDIFRT